MCLIKSATIIQYIWWVFSWQILNALFYSALSKLLNVFFYILLQLLNNFFTFFSNHLIRFFNLNNILKICHKYCVCQTLGQSLNASRILWNIECVSSFSVTTGWVYAVIIECVCQTMLQLLNAFVELSENYWTSFLPTATITNYYAAISCRFSVSI